MKFKGSAEFTSFDFFLVRRSQFPVDFFLSLDKLANADQAVFASSFGKLIAANDEFLKALYLASPAFHERTLQWLTGKTISEETQLVRTLLKYWSRICSRATPYGLFAGVSLGSWAYSTRIVPDKSKDRIYNELDITQVNQIIDLLLQDQHLAERCLFYANNSIYTAGNDIRYVEYEMHEGKAKYFLTSTENSDVLASLMLLAKKGCYLSDLRKSLLSKGFSETQAHEFVDDLVEFQLLTSELQPRITTASSLQHLIDRLQNADANSQLLQTLTEIVILLKSSEGQPANFDVVKNLIASAFPGEPVKNLIQTTLQQGYSQCTIQKTFVDELTRSLSRLKPLFVSAASPNLRRFQKEFYDKFGSAEIPLAIALDGEIGIDYGHASRLSSVSVLDGLDLNSTAKQARELTDWDQFILKHYLNYIDSTPTEIRISTEDLSSFTTAPSLNPTFYGFGNLIGQPDSADGELMFNLSFVGGNSAAALMARFSGTDPVLHSKLVEIADYEQSCVKDSILAEIVFLPESRTGNVLSHPALYPYEIPYITLSTVDQQHQLPIDDLLVASTASGKITLRSKKLGKQVIPRLSNAHFYVSELPVYQFLCDLQSDSGSINFKWTWSVLEDRPMLPRVCFENLILSRKTWNLDQSWSKNPATFIAKYDVPRYVQLIEGDNELLLDLQLPVSLHMLAEQIERKGKAQLKEFLSPKSQCLIADEHGSYSNEIIIPFKATNYQSLPPKICIESANGIQRKFSFGDPWLYIKIYAGYTIVDKTLLETVTPICNKLLQEGKIEKWFFIRYQDPQPHLRLRLLSHSYPDGIDQTVLLLKAELDPLVQQGLIDKFALDTYERELERYGPQHIELAETIFAIDTQLTTQLLAQLQQHQADEHRWLYGCRIVDAALEGFMLTLDQRAAITRDFASGFLSDFTEKEKIEIRLNDKYRLLRKELETVMGVSEDPLSQQTAVLCRNYTEQISRQLNASQHHFTWEQIGAFVHMCCNRLFISESREQELLVYHFLAKHYKSKIARKQSVLENR